MAIDLDTGSIVTINNGGSAEYNDGSAHEVKSIDFSDGTNTWEVWKAETPILSAGTYASGYSGTYRGNLNGNTSYNPFSYTAGSGIKYEGSLTGNNTRAGNAYINQQINASNFNTLTFKFNTTGAAWSGNTGWTSGNYLQFGLASATGSATAAPTFTQSTKITSGSTLNESYTIDISGQTGNKYISIWVSFGGRAYTPFTITDIILS